MAIQEVSKAQFDGLNLFDHCQAHWDQTHEREWYVDSDQRLVGVLLEDVASGRWGYSICRHDEDGQFRRIALGADVPTLAMARRELLSSMQRELAA